MAFDPWSAVIAAGTLLFVLSLVPQVVRTLQLRRADDISEGFLFMVLAASAFTMAYWFRQGEWIAASGFVFNLAAWSFVLYFRLRPGARVPLVPALPPPKH